MNFVASQDKNEPDGDKIFFQSNLLNHFEQKACHNTNENQSSHQCLQNKNQENKEDNIFQCKEHKQKAIFVCQDSLCTYKSKQGCSKCMNIYHSYHANITTIETPQQMEDEEQSIQKQTAQIKQQFMRFQKMIKVPIETIQNEGTHQSVNEQDLDQQQYQQKQQKQINDNQQLGKVNSQINQTEEKILKKNTLNTNIAIDVNQIKELQYSKNLFLHKLHINYQNETQDISKNAESFTKIHLKQNVLENKTKNIDFVIQNNASQNLTSILNTNNLEQRVFSSYQAINPIQENIKSNYNQLINFQQNLDSKINNSNQFETKPQQQFIQKLSIPSFENTQHVLEQKNQLIFLPTQYIPCFSYVQPQFPQNYLVSIQPSQVQYVSQNQLFIPQQNVQQNMIQNISNFQNYTPFNILNNSIQPQINNTQQQLYSFWMQPQAFNQNNNLSNENVVQQNQINNYFIQNSLNQNEQSNYLQNYLINLNNKTQSEELNQFNNNNNNSTNQQQIQNDISVTSLSVNQYSDQIKNCNHQITHSQLKETKNINFSQQLAGKSQDASQIKDFEQQLNESANPFQAKQIGIQTAQNVKVEAFESIEQKNEERYQKAVANSNSENLEKDQQSQQELKQVIVTLKQEEQEQQKRNTNGTIQIERVQLRKFESEQIQQKKDNITLERIEYSKNMQSQQSIERVQLVPYRTTQLSVKGACNPNGIKKVSVQYFIDNKCMKSQYTSIDKVIHQNIDYYPQIAFLNAECFLQISVNTFEMKYYLNLVDIKQKKILQRREASGIFQYRNSSIFEENKLIIQKINNNISALYERGENQVDFISNSTLKVVKRLNQYSIQKVISYNYGRGLAIASLSGQVTLYNINCNKFVVINQFNVKNIKSKYFSLQQNLNQNQQSEQQQIVNQDQDEDGNENENEERRRQGARYEKFTFMLNCDIFIQDNKLIWCGSSLFKFTYCIVDISSSARMILEPTQANYPDGILNNDQFKIQISNLHVFNDRVYFEFSYLGKESDQFLNNQNSSSVLLQSKYTVLQYKMNNQEDILQLIYHSIHPNSNIIKVTDPQNQIFLYNQQKSHVIGILFEKQPKKKQQQILHAIQNRQNNDKRMVIINDIAYFSSLFKQRSYKENYDEIKFKMNVSQFQNSQTLYFLLNTNGSTSSQNQKFITLVDNKKIFHKVFLSQSQYTTKIK
ncbi:hypothetical protein ABPG72_001262 [Tetrahymena utriculariae]